MQLLKSDLIHIIPPLAVFEQDKKKQEMHPGRKK